MFDQDKQRDQDKYEIKGVDQEKGLLTLIDSDADEEEEEKKDEDKEEDEDEEEGGSKEKEKKKKKEGNGENFLSTFKSLKHHNLFL